MTKYILLFIQLFLSLLLWSQTLTQNIKGNVQAKIFATPIAHAKVVLDDDSTKVSLTDSNGFFQFENVPVGRHKINVTSLQYVDITMSNLLLNSGKELILTIDMEEQVVFTQSAKVSKKINKSKPLNDMSVVSTRTFSVEETQKFAAALNDPARMATSFAGVVGGSDGGNSITIRGNSPTGILWRLEGVDIPSPNHFSAFNSSGGGISILSAQLMGNSDFMTGAFSSEYGNALSGVFDIKLRKGNTKKREFTLQAGFLGLDMAAEGPLSKKGGSYLVNYRYSTLGILSKMGIDIGGAATLFQDLSYNVYFPKSKLGQFTAFGFGGKSSSIQYAKKDSSAWKTESDRSNYNFSSNTMATGFTHFINLTKKSTLKSVLVYTNTYTLDFAEFYKKDYTTATINYDNRIANRKIALNTTYNLKINSKLHLRAGLIGTLWHFSARQRELDSLKVLRTYLNQNGNTQYVQSYSQLRIKVSKKLTTQMGLHCLFLNLNKNISIEPRAAVQYALKYNKTISLGYGLHSQLQLPGVYFAQVLNAQNRIEYPNEKLKFSKAHHVVLGYEINLKHNNRIKLETYYQYLYQIPISKESGSNFSVINQAWGIISSPLQNKGKGENYGLELTYEKYLTKGLYYLFSGSVYQSKYKTLTNKWINTLFNSQRAVTFTAGKEFSYRNNQRILGFNVKTSWYGGFWQTPIDLEKSKLYKQTIEDVNNPFSKQLNDYFRTDIRVSLRNNHKHFNSIWSLDIQNVTNHKNIGGSYYDVEKESIKTWYQTPLIPVLSYKIEF